MSLPQQGVGPDDFPLNLNHSAILACLQCAANKTQKLFLSWALFSLQGRRDGRVRLELLDSLACPQFKKIQTDLRKYLNVKILIKQQEQLK